MLVEPDARAHGIVHRHHPIGASTGYMDTLREDWDAQVAAARAISSAAVELSVLSEKQLPGLVEYLSADRQLPFRYLSIHGPAKDRELGEDELVALLSELGQRANAIVMHPDTIHRRGNYTALGRKLVIENMDARKTGGRSLAELLPIFHELPEAGFCFDIAHAWSIDPEMRVAKDLLDGLSDRLRQVHLSSLSPELHHIPLTEGDERLFTPALERCVDVPWILEAPPRQ